MDEKYLDTWTCYQVIDSRSICIFRFGAVSWRQHCIISTICTILYEQNWVVYTICSLSWPGQYWRRTSRVRVEGFPRAHNAEAPPGSPKHDGERSHSARRFQGSKHLHVDVQRHLLGPQRQGIMLYTQFLRRYRMCQKVPRGHWSFLGPGSEEKWCATPAFQPDGLWNKVVDEMLILFATSGHPVFRGTSAISRGPLKSKDGGTTPIHYNAEPTIAEQLLRIILSVNQLNVYGAVAGWCQDLAQRTKAHLHLARRHPLRTWTMIPRFKSHQMTYWTSPNHQSEILEPEETWCGKKFENLPEDLQRTNAGDDAGFIRHVSRTIPYLPFPTFSWQDRAQQAHVENIRILEVTTDPSRKDLFEATPKLVRYWKSRWRNNLTVMELKARSNLCRKTQSWMVLSRGAGKYVSELSEESKKPVHFEDASSSKGKLVAMEQREQFRPVFIFVINLTDQTANVEGKTLRSEGYWRHLPQNLEIDDKNLETLWWSSRRLWSIWMEKVATCVLTRLTWSEDVDEASMAESTTKQWEKTSVLLRLQWSFSSPWSR